MDEATQAGPALVVTVHTMTDSVLLRAAYTFTDPVSTAEDSTETTGAAALEGAEPSEGRVGLSWVSCTITSDIVSGVPPSSGSSSVAHSLSSAKIRSVVVVVGEKKSKHSPCAVDSVVGTPICRHDVCTWSKRKGHIDGF